jgi:hypothetical protein
MVNKDIAGVSVFLVLYAAILAWMLFLAVTRRIKLKTRWSLLLLHMVIRVASQAVGVAFYVLAFRNIGVFVAYVSGLALHFPTI